jgi:hypothetical protein
MVVVDPDTELKFLRHLPIELMWGVGPATRGLDFPGRSLTIAWTGKLGTIFSDSGQRGTNSISNLEVWMLDIASSRWLDLVQTSS